MFSPGSEKNCLRPESCSPSRNVPTRFPTGVPPMGDESQQINRIQLAVQKYNSNSLSNNRSGFLLPMRHCLLKNTLRSKNYETEEGLTKNEKKSGNYYEGVGAFPTIHLKKSAIRYRPIRKFRDVKVPYPELPVNRYLSHLPELCTDLKSSTRSVLDVLQDLSAKKIQDEDDGNKTKSKGLAGDYIMGPNAVYKPLFVQKPKLNSVTTRDSMTQTSSPFQSDTSSPQICNLNSRNDAADPKAELRKKLAKQNNEIYASLSSSITSSFAIKRKIEKLTAAKDDDRSPDGSAVKKSRIDHPHAMENGFTVNNKVEPLKPSRKLKLIEASSPSPNKDRLTTIFLDIRSTSPKSKIFQDSSSDTFKSNSISNGFDSNPPTINGSEEIKVPEEPLKTDSGKKENEQSKPMFSFPMNTPDANGSKPTTPTTQFSLSKNVSFNFKSTESPSAPSTDSAVVSQTRGLVVGEKKDETLKTFTFGSNGGFSGFKFGSETTKSVEEKTETSGTATITTPATSPQFTFGVKSSDSPSPLSGTTAESTLSSPGTSLFTFGSSEAPKTTTSVSPLSVTQNIQPGMFTYGQKPAAESPVQTSTQTSQTTSTPLTTQAPSQSSVAVSSVAPTGGLFSFGSKTETLTTTIPATSTAEQKPQFMFTFGQKSEPLKAQESEQKNLYTFGQKLTPETSQSKTAESQAPTFTQPAVIFGGFGTPATNVTSTTPLQPTFGASTTQAPNIGTTGQSTTTFGITTTVTPTFGASTASAFGAATTTTPAFGASTTTTSTLGASTTATPTLGASTIATPTLGASTIATPTLGASTTATPTLGASTTATPTLGASTTATPTLGASTTATLTFGASSTPTPIFSASTRSTTVFGSSTTITPAFGASTTAVPAYGSSTTITPSFGTTTTTSSAFGASSMQPTFKFGASTKQTNFPSHDTSTTTQSTFGLNTSQPTTAFGASTSGQSTTVFGDATTKPTPTFGVTSATSAFGASSSSPGFGTSTTTPMFGTSALTMTSFGTPTTQNAFGASATQTTSQSIPAFGTSSLSGFGAPSTIQSTSNFGSSTATSSAFGAPVSNGFGTSQPSGIFGTSATTQSGFGAITTTVFGKSTDFGSSSQSNPGFGTSGGTQTTSAFGAQPFGKPSAPSLFGQNTAPAFSSGNNFAPTQNNFFGAKPNDLGQNKIFGGQNNFQFGSTTSSTGFTTSPPTTTAAPVFSFGAGGGAATNSFSFTASTSAGPSNTQTPFAFTPNEPFKFGASTGKENSGFGASPNFNFGGQMNNPAPNTSFDFGQAQNPAATGFNFSAGNSATPSVFSFGSSGSSSSSNRGFNFGTPTPNASFGQSTPTFGVPGTFSIGSGSSQSRPRAASRLRRRP